MAASLKRLASFKTEFVFVATQIADPTLANVETAVGVATNKINEVSDAGDLASTASFITLPLFGEDRESQIPGQIAASSVDITVSADNSDAMHTALRDADPLTESSLIFVYSSGTDSKTYAHVPVRVGGHSYSNSISDVVKLTFNFAITGDITYTDKA